MMAWMRGPVAKAIFGGFTVAVASLAVGRVLEPAERAQVAAFARAMGSAMAGASLTREDVDE